MNALEISADTPVKVLMQLALSIHRATGGLPVALKCRNRPGVLVNRDGSAETAYESKALDTVFTRSDVGKVRVDSGRYLGMQMMVSPLEDREGRAVVAIGVVDDLGTLNLQEFAEIGESIRKQVINGK